MTKEQFDREWLNKLNKPFDTLRGISDSPSWHTYVAENIHKLSFDAKFYIANNSDTMGDWLLELVSPDILERAIGLEHDDG